MHSFFEMRCSIDAYFSNLMVSMFTELFGALPSSLQCSILLRVVDTAADVLSQCRLFLLVVDRYPNQLSDQGVS